ncbi:hypothetical protein L2095_07970 [Bacillus zanthoxyli]|nr:hypothetical protein [Bacillus zanthoxyli]
MRYRPPSNRWDEQFEIDYEQNLKDIERDISNTESGLQEAKTNASKAKVDTEKALIDVTKAVETAESTREQLDAIVSRETDSDAMSRQAAVDSYGVDKGNLKKRIDDDYDKVTTQLTDIAKMNINKFPRLNGETHDIPRINRALAYLKGLNRRAELLFNAETYTVIPQKTAAGDTSSNTDIKRIRLRDNVSLIGIRGKTIFKVSDNNPNYHALIEEEKPNVDPIKNVRIRYITFDHNVYNNAAKPDGSINNHKETFRIYKSDNVSIRNCKIITHGINPLNFRMGLVQADLNNGIYPNKNIDFKNNEMVFVALDLPYFDNTFVTFCGDGIDIYNNKISAERVSDSIVGGDNTAIEVSGRNIVCEENNIDNYLLGIDVTTLDSFAENRNIKITRNKIYNVGRAIKLWGGYSPSYVLNGVVVNRNNIKLAHTLYKSRQENSTRCGIGLANHTTASLGTFKNIDILDNKIKMDDSVRDYLLTLSYSGSYYLGLEFDAHYNGLYFGGSSALVDGLNIGGNEFGNLPCPSMYFSHNLIKNVNILNNLTVNGGYGKRSPIFSFKKFQENFLVDKNVFIDTGVDTMNGQFLYWFGSSSLGATFKNFTLGNNTEYVRSGLYTSTRGNLYSSIKTDRVNNFIDAYSSVVRGGLSLKNNIINGDFSSGTSSWFINGGVFSAANNTLSLTGDGTLSYTRAFQHTTIPAVFGNKVYVRFKCRLNNDRCSYIQIVYSGSVAGSGSIVLQNTPKANQWYDLSTTFAIPSSIQGNITIYFVAYYPDAPTATNQIMDIKNVLAISLSDVYGVDNEPNTNQFTLLIDEFFNSWFNGTRSVGGMSIGGSSSSRPALKSIGTCYFDSTLGIPIWWNGSSWVNSTGNTV